MASVGRWWRVPTARRSRSPVVYSLCRGVCRNNVIPSQRYAIAIRAYCVTIKYDHEMYDLYGVYDVVCSSGVRFICIIALAMLFRGVANNVTFIRQT